LSALLPFSPENKQFSPEKAIENFLLQASLRYKSLRYVYFITYSNYQYGYTCCRANAKFNSFAGAFDKIAPLLLGFLIFISGKKMMEISIL
jgi:hypothetical protein